MIMNTKRILFSFILLTSSFAFAQTATQDRPPSTQPKNTQAATHAPQQHEEAGARIFRQNCSRCHNAPDGFSPRISGTVVRHMGVRASLSMRDKEELLRFLNP
jgi:cytochrome c5